MNCVVFDAFIDNLISGNVHFNNRDEFYLAIMDSTFKLGDKNTDLSITWNDLKEFAVKTSKYPEYEDKLINLLAEVIHNDDTNEIIITNDQDVKWSNLKDCNGNGIKLKTFILYDKNLNIPIACYTLDKAKTVNDTEIIIKTPTLLKIEL